MNFSGSKISKLRILTNLFHKSLSFIIHLNEEFLIFCPGLSIFNAKKMFNKINILLTNLTVKVINITALKKLQKTKNSQETIKLLWNISSYLQHYFSKMLDSNSIMFTSLTDIFSIDFDFKNVLNNQFSYHQQALS